MCLTEEAILDLKKFTSKSKSEFVNTEQNLMKILGFKEICLITKFQFKKRNAAAPVL